MRKMFGTLAAVGALALMSLSAGPAAAATVPSGYGNDDVTVDIVLPDRLLYGGDIVQVEVHAKRAGQPLVCDSLTVTFEPGLVEEFNGGGQSDFSFELKTEVVQQRTPTNATATCTFTPLQAQSGESGVASATVAALPAVSTLCGTGCVTNSSVVTLLPRDGAGNAGGFLPKTGTEIGLWLLVAGGVLVLGGTGVALVARRRSS